MVLQHLITLKEAIHEIEGENIEYVPSERWKIEKLVEMWCVKSNSGWMSSIWLLLLLLLLVVVVVMSELLSGCSEVIELL